MNAKLFGLVIILKKDTTEILTGCHYSTIKILHKEFQNEEIINLGMGKV